MRTSIFISLSLVASLFAVETLADFPRTKEYELTIHGKGKKATLTRDAFISRHLLPKDKHYPTLKLVKKEGGKYVGTNTNNETPIELSIVHTGQYVQNAERYWKKKYTVTSGDWSCDCREGAMTIKCATFDKKTNKEITSAFLLFLVGEPLRLRASSYPYYDKDSNDMELLFQSLAMFYMENINATP